MSELTERTIFEHAEALRKKEYSSVQLTQAYLEQIDKKDKTIGAYITVTADRAKPLMKEDALIVRFLRLRAFLAVSKTICAQKE